MNHFEKEKLLKEISYNMDFYQELINISKGSLLDYKKRLENALIENNIEEIRIVSHSIKGMASSIFCPILEDLAQKSEFKSQKNDISELKYIIQQLMNEIQNLLTNYLI